jgi:hypothetical protein
MQHTGLAGARAGSPEPDLAGEDWTIPGDHAAGHELDPWMGVLDEGADDGERLFPYPSGLP